MMKFRVGYKVKFKDEPGMGIVTRVDEKGLVYVETEDGFERPVYPSDLMHTEMYSPTVPAGAETPREHEASPSVQETPSQKTVSDDAPPAGSGTTEVLVGVVQRNEKFVFYLINDSDYDLAFIFGRMKGGTEAVLLERGELEAGTKYLLAELLPEGEQVMYVQCLLYSGRRFVPRPPLDRQIPFSITAIPRSREFRKNPYFDERAWLVSLMPQAVPRPSVDEQEKKEVLRSKGDLKPYRRKMMVRPAITGHEPVEEVDLHIEAIVEESAGMSNGEILEVQLARFETALEGALRSGQKKIVFIHGLGQGKLKNEVRKRLEKRGIAYQDAPFKEYGYGATMAVLKGS
jgi:hypothetical protein